MFGWSNKNNRDQKERHEEPADQELARHEAKYGDGNTLDPKKALEHILHVGFYRSFQTPEIVEGDHIRLPAWDITITPAVDELTERGAVLSFYIDSPAWGRTLYECCAAPGKDTRQAIGMALGSFLFCFMEGIGRMVEQKEPRELETVFAKKTHRWKAYPSVLVATGEKVEQSSPTLYWDALQGEIVKRLGDQKLCYVKIYAAKIRDEIIGECRIDDVKSEELSALVADMAQKWDVKEYASHKQFFFIRQEEETVLPDPWAGAEGRQKLRETVHQAVLLFLRADTEEKYDDLPSLYAQRFGDRTLAQELHWFLPEICAEIAFGEQVRMSEQIGLCIGENAPIYLYKNQLAHYYLLRDTIDQLFRSGTYGEQTNDIFRQYVGVSASYSGIRQLQEKGSSLEGARQSALLFSMTDDFQIW